MEQDERANASVAKELTRRLALRKLGGAGLLATVAGVLQAGVGAAQEGLTEEEADTLADRFVAAFNGGEAAGFDALLAADAPVHWFWPVPAEGPGHLAAVTSLVRTIFPDAAIAVDELLVSGNWITALGSVRGTHTGTVLGLPPTGRPFAIDLIVVARTAELIVQEIWIQYDLAHLAVQLGDLADMAQSLLAVLRGGAAAGATPPAHSTAVALDDLVSLDGVVVAVEFGPDGSLVGYRSEIDLPKAEIAQMAAVGPSFLLLLDAATRRYSEQNALELTPPAWTIYSGGDRWTVVLAGNRVIVAETATVDFNALYEAVVGPR